MKRFLLTISLVFGCFIAAFSQDNSKADSILGTYFVSHEGEDSRVKIVKGEDGTFTARVIWVKNDKDKKGQKRLDAKNPDRNLRSTPCDEIVIMWGLKYNPESKCWDSGKVYDPTRGIRANAMCRFVNDKDLKIKGSLMGFSQTVVWKKEASK